MSCIIESKKGKGIESPLGKKLIDVYKNIDKASDVYSKLSHPIFLDKFGDWINENIPRRTNDVGEPLLITRVGVNGAKNYYFEDKYGNEMDLITNEFSSFDEANLSNVINEITHQIGNYIFNKHIKENFNDLDAMEAFNLESEIRNFVQDKVAENEELKEFADSEELEGLEYVIEQLNNVITHIDEFQVELFNYFKSKNLTINDVEIEEDTQNALEQGLTGGDIKQSFENNTKDKASANTKLLLSFLPKYEYDSSTGEFDKVYGSILGEESFMNMHSIHQELLKEFSDIVPNETITGIEDVYDIMVQKLNKLAKTKPYYDDLLNLLNNADENKKTEFTIALSHKFNNFVVGSWDSNSKTYKIINSSTQNDIPSQILTNWAKSFTNLFLTKELVETKEPYLTPDGQISTKTITRERTVYSSSKIEALENDIKLLSDTFTNANSKYNINTISINDFATRFMESSVMLENILADLGVNISENAFKYYISKLNQDSISSGKIEFIKTMQVTISNLSHAITKLKAQRLNTKRFNVINSYKKSIFGELAKAEAFYTEDLTDTNVLANNKMYWAFSNPSYISNQVNKFKKDPSTIREITKNTINNHSLWADVLLGEVKNDEGDFVYDKAQREIESKKALNDLSLNLFTSFQEEGKASEGVSNGDISEVDQLIDEINKVENTFTSPSYSTSTPGDKSTRYEIAIKMFIDDVTTRSNNSGNIESVFSDKVLNIFKNYFLDEYNRMKDATQEIKSLKESDLKVHYHTSKGQLYSKEGKVLGNAFKSQIFAELSHESISPELNEKLNLYSKDGTPRLLEERVFSPIQEEIIKEEINKILNNMIVENFKELESKRIIQKHVDGNGAVKYILNGIDKRILQEYGADRNGMLTQAAATNLVASYSVNSTVANVEYTKLFTGDPAMFKNMVDFFKRVPATYSDGLPLRLSEPGDKHFKIAVLENQVVQSPYLEEIKKSLKKVGKTDSEIKDIVKLYVDDVNSTDAQAWITPQRWKFIIEKSGKWNDHRARVYDKMMGINNDPLTYEDFKYAAQPLKGVYFGVVNGVPTYLKYSQAVLIPSMIKGSELDSLYKSMIKDPNNIIDEAITLDGVKVGASTPNPITNDEGTIIETNLTSITLNNSEWKLQQDLPTKLMKPTLVGSQIQKNIFSSIEPDGIYYQNDGSVLTGLQMIEAINDALSELSNKGIDELSLKLGLDDSNRIDSDKFYEILEEEVLNGNYSLNTIKAVQKGMPLEALPGLKNKLNNIFFSKVKNAAVKIKTNGGSFIQMSNFGLDRVTADEVGIKWLLKPDALKPPIIVDEEITNEDGTKSTVSKIQPGQIFINHSVIAKYIPDYETMSMEELNSKIDPKLLQIIGYRIPNQGMSSNDPLQVVGILPPTMGDTIVAYTEIPAKTGSDFDIDKMYAMVPEYNPVYNKSTYKKVKEFINNGTKDLTIEQENELLGELIDDSNIELEVKDIKNILFASNEYDVNDIYVNSIINHLMDKTSTSELSKQYKSEYSIDEVSELKYVDSKGSTKKALNNKLFELYWSVLVNKNTYADLITPIDFSYLKDHIKYLHGDNSKVAGDNLRFYNPIYQLKLKHIYGSSKSGVGITANQLVDHNRSKHVVNLKFNNLYLGVGYNVNDETVFDTYKGNNLSEKLISSNPEFHNTQFKISDTISAFMNAFVDNAKDPYISDGNYNTYTSSATFLLVRAGVHPYYINAFMGQPILKELAQFVKDYESKSIPKEEAWKSSKQVFKEMYVKRILGPKTKDSDIYKYLAKFKEGTIFNYDMLEDNIKNNASSGSEIDFMNNQLLILASFDFFTEQGKKLNESVSLSRMDTEGGGKNAIEMTTTINKVKEIINKQSQPKEIANHDKKYFRNGKLTSLGTQLLNVLEFPRNIINNNDSLFLLSSQPVIDIMNDISLNSLNSYGGTKGLLKDAKLGSLISNEMYSYLLSKFPPLQITGNKLQYIQQTLNEVIEFKESQSEDIDERNFFIDSLVFYNDSFGLNFGNMPKETKDDLYRSFRDLYFENPSLGNAIIRSAYHMNGFNSNLIDFRDFIPHEFFIRNDFRNFLRQESINLQKGEYLNDFIDKFIRTNYDNNNLVATVSPKRIKPIMHVINNVPTTVGFKLDSTIELNAKTYSLGENIYGQLMFPKFLKYKTGQLFELHGYIKGDPYYKLTSKLGYKDKKSHLNIREYDVTSSDFYSDINTQQKIKEADKKAKGYSKSTDYVPVEFHNNFNIPNIYSKNLSEILLPQENVVSLQKLNQDKNIFKEGNAFYKKIGEPFNIPKERIKNYVYSDIIEYLSSIPIPKKFGTNLIQRKMYEITNNRSIEAINSLINETRELNIDFSSLTDVIDLMKNAQEEFEQLNRRIPETKEEGERFIELLNYKNNLIKEILSILKNKYNLDSIPEPSNVNNDLVISNKQYLGVINEDGILQDMRSNIFNNNEESPLIQNKVDEILDNKNFIKLSEDERYYINTKTGKKYQRVTEYISDKDFETNSLVESSLTIGTKIDELVRDFFDNSLKDLKSYNITDNIKELKSFIKSLEKVKINLEKRNETVLANDIILYNDDIGVAGTVDLLTYDNKGIFRIYDMKTQRGDQMKTNYRGDNKVKYDTEKYGKSNRQKHQEQLSMYRILLNNTHNIKAKQIGVMPIEVSYNAGDVKTSIIKLLKGISHKPLDSVKDAVINKESENPLDCN